MSEFSYRDFSAEFRTIQATMRKKLLKKPNLNEALKQFWELAAAMEEADVPDQAARCHQEIAAIHARLANLLMERRHLLKAAHLFREAASKRRKMHLTSSNDFVQLMEECYLAAIERMLKQASPRLAGMAYMEMSAQLEELDESGRCFPLLIKANRLLQGDIYAQLAILDKMADLVEKQQPSREEALAELQCQWNSLQKAQIGDAIRPQLLALEGRLLLLHLLHCRPPPANPYDGQWRNAQGKSSVANREEFSAFSRLTSLVREENYLQASQLYTLELDRMLDGRGRALCKKLLASLNIGPSINRDLDELLESEAQGEVEKRMAMFELVDGLKNQKKSSKLNLENV